MKRIQPRLLAFSLLALACLPATATAQRSRDVSGRQGEVSSNGRLERFHLAAVRQAYRAAEWPRGTRRDGLRLGTLELPGWTGLSLQAQQGRLERRFHAAGDPEETPVFAVEARVHETIQEAHEELVRWLGGLSTVGQAPSAQQRGIALGEASFVGPAGVAPATLSWVAFVRGNVSVRLLNIDPRRTPDLDLGALARAIDADAMRRPTLQAEIACPKPTIERLGLPASSAVAGEPLVIDVDVSERTGGTPHLSWRVTGSAQGYVERRGDDWVLFTTGPGALNLTLEATGSTGTWRSASVSLDVLDD